MSFMYWEGLSEQQKADIIAKAKEAQDKSRRNTCFWCRSSFGLKGYDFTSNAHDPREICKGVCGNRRFFDDPQ